MGGTRCVFQGCQVSSQRNPKMHFFKLPVRDPALLEAWLRNCGNAHILNVAREKLGNRAVCARHFRYECFMNYKMDRLIPKQTPTLLRASKELAWDMEHLDENGEASMVKLSVPKLTHLIPPENFECPLGFTDDKLYGRKYAVKRSMGPKPLPMDTNKRQKVVHVQEQDAPKRIDVSLTVDLTDNSNDNTAKLELSERTNDLKAGPAEEEFHVTTNSIMPMSPTKKSLKDLQHIYDELKDSFDRIAKENGDLKHSVIKLEAEAELHKKTSLSCAPPAPQLTKLQLYNSIKKYLGPTMAALVRMEMFGGAERAWKDDERDFATELLQLGENVYAHCCDEWRFRLPSLRLARSWLENTGDPDDADDENL